MKTEKEKMLVGELYNALNPQLVAERRRARRLLKELNDSSEEQPQVRARVFNQLFKSVGKDLWIEPPFYCDYGSNIILGDKVHFNFNCVILDPAEVLIGDYVLFGPHVQIYTATHPLSHMERRKGLEFARPIEIGSHVWVGATRSSAPV